MQIEITGYGRAQRILGHAPVWLELPDHCTALDALNSLAVRFPDFASLLEHTACARSDQLIARDQRLQDGDQLALIPPVSGG